MNEINTRIYNRNFQWNVIDNRCTNSSVINNGNNNIFNCVNKTNKFNQK